MEAYCLLLFHLLMHWCMQTGVTCLIRKTFLQLQCGNNTIVGIGGPTAPHVFSLDRVDDLRAMSYISHTTSNFPSGRPVSEALNEFVLDRCSY